MAARERTMAASEFKAKCLGLLDDVAAGRESRIVLTKRGRPVAALVPLVAPDPLAAFGWMKGTVEFPPDLDLTRPSSDFDEWSADGDAPWPPSS